MELIKTKHDTMVSARDIWKELGHKRKFSNWIRIYINKASLKEDIDYLVFKEPSTGGRPKIEYELSIYSAMLICSMMAGSNNNAIPLYKKLSKEIGKEVFVIPKTRKEMLFEISLIDVFKDILEIIPQYFVLDKYRIDYFIPDFNVGIEYDEHHHATRGSQDARRQEEIESELGCKIIRVKEGFEQEGLNEILKVLFFSIWSDWYFGKEISEVQIGIMERLGEKI